MKSKIPKIMGVATTLVLLLSLLVFAAPASAATLKWSTITMPNPAYKQFVETDDVDFVLIAKDGKTMFAYGNTDKVLYKSTDGGVKWSTTNVGTGLNTATVVAMAISPGFATDGIVVAASATTVYRSSDSGTTFGEVSTALLLAASGADGVDVFITSIDVTDKYYTGGQPAILVGTKDTGANEGGGVFLCRLDTWTWTDLTINNAAAGTGAGGVADVYAVAFSPNHRTDAQLLAVAVGATAGGSVDYDDDTYITVKAAGSNWGIDVLTAKIAYTSAALTIDESELTRAVIAFPSDYEWSTNNKVFVGTTSTDTERDDVFRVSLALPGGTSSATDLDVGGTTTETNVYSLAASGPYVGATVLVGRTDSTTVKRTSDPSLSTVTWSSTVKSPIGDATTPNVIVLVAPDFATSKKVYAATTGANSALSVSTDGGVYFNGLALIDVSDDGATTVGARLRFLDSAIVDATTMFVLIHDDADAGGDFDAAEPQHLFKTTDGGTSWQRVWFVKPTGTTDVMTIVKVSPTYATDQTVYVAQNDTRLWKSSDGGNRVVGLAAPGNITALALVDGSTYFTGHDDGKVYKSGQWNYGTTVAAAVKSMVLSPTFATDDTLFLGNADGDVYYTTTASSTALTFTYSRLGVDDELGDGATVIVATDPAYATNKTIYGLSSTATVGVNRWVVGTSVTWLQLDDDTDFLAGSGLALAADGTLYAASNTANKGVRRELSPSAATRVGFESMVTDLPVGAKLVNLSLRGGVLYGLVSSIATPSTSYAHGYSLLTITDTFAITPVLTTPADGAQVDASVTLLTLGWDKVVAPDDVTVYYKVQVATDSAYANKILDVETSGTVYTVTGLVPGTTYWWRVYVAATKPLVSLKAKRSFVVKLGKATQSTTLGSPAPGATGVPRRPNFQWEPVTNATGYRLEVAENPDFKPALVSKLLDTTVWTMDSDLKNSTVYYWRVKALSPTTEGEWSRGIFTTAAAPVPPVTPAPAPPPVTITQVPAPIITVTVPAAPPAPAPITPSWIYAIIIVGAVLVIAVIVLIVRTRRVV